MGNRAGASAICGDMRSECHPERVSTIDMCMAMSGDPIPQADEKLSKLSPWVWLRIVYALLWSMSKYL